MTSQKSTLSRRRRQNSMLKRGAMTVRKITVLFVEQLPFRSEMHPKGLMRVGSTAVECAVGRSGIGIKRREGDGVTPVGCFSIVGWLRRADRWRTNLNAARAIFRSDGWCDDAASQNYNRPVRQPTRFSAETLWRKDNLYDVVGILNFNFKPRVVGRGSAIFLHLAHETLQATAGCVAIRPQDMRRIEHRLAKRPKICIGSSKAAHRCPKIAEPTRMWVAPSWIACSKSRSCPWRVFLTRSPAPIDAEERNAAQRDNPPGGCT